MSALETALMPARTPLSETRDHELLRISTAGSVDDGKSTLIGRLLYDSKGVYEDQISSVRKATVNQSTGGLDLSLLTDGLRAEREQGITIDVAYRYFSTPRRKFIIADTPGHEQYTRNMATGASTANLAIILVDARNGVLRQSRRHAYIAALLGIPHIVVAINKMDLVDFRQDVFESIREEFSAFAAQLELRDLHFIPICALAGDNVVTKSDRMPWFGGESLLTYLETVHIASDRNFTDLRFPVQYVIRPNLDFRGYAGQIASGVLRPGDEVMVLPSGRTTRVRSITTYDGDLEKAFPPMSITVCLEDELDISRGDVLVHPMGAPEVSRRFEANLVWMSQKPLEPGRPYLIKHSTQQMRASIREIRHKINVNTLEREPASELHLNEIGAVAVETHRALFFDAYKRNRATGAFIIIDPLTNETVGAGMITGQEHAGARRKHELQHAAVSSRVSLGERQSRSGHRPATVWLYGSSDLAYAAERRLFDRGCLVHVVEHDDLSADFARIAHAAGLITICLAPAGEAPEDVENLVVVDAKDLPEGLDAAADEICRQLEHRAFIPREAGWTGGEGI